MRVSARRAFSDLAHLTDMIVLHRVRLYAAGWALLGMGAWSELAWLDDQTFSRMSSAAIFYALGGIVLAWTIVFVTSASLYRRTVRFSIGILANGFFVFPTIANGLFFPYPFYGSVCGERSGCFFLATAPAMTDTIYEIWRAPSPDPWILDRLDVWIDYSEDGSYTSDPHLLLSANEQILVLARGGYFVDAIDLSQNEVISGKAHFSDPDREEEMRKRSAQIGEILKRNGSPTAHP